MLQFLLSIFSCAEKSMVIRVHWFIFVFSILIQYPCWRMFEIVCVHQQREFFNIQKAWGASKRSRLNWHAPRISFALPFLNLLSHCSQTQSKLEFVELRSKNFTLSCLEGILRFVLNYSSKQQDQFSCWPAIATASTASISTWHYYTIG